MMSDLNDDLDSEGGSASIHETISADEAVLAGAANLDFFNHYFFPKAFPEESPEFHIDMQSKLLKPGRLKGFKVFRGGSKTTLLRAFSAYRIAYAFMDLAMIVSESSRHSKYTLQWLKTAVERNHLYADTFHLSRGEKWSEEEIEIVQSVPGMEEKRIRILGFGITGQIRGFNFDDDRPDFILVDDPCNEENTATPEAREKITKLVMGALVNGLSSPKKSPHAMMCLAQTPLDDDDLISEACNSETWDTAAYSCFDEEGNSVWEDQHPTKFLKQNKADYIRRNQLALWMSEMEVTIVSAASADFVPSWLKQVEEYYTDGVNIMAIDPTPPPKPTEMLGKNTSKRLDDFVIMIINIHPERGAHVQEAIAMKQPMNPEIFSNFFHLAGKWKVLYTFVETVLFARTVAYSLRDEMTARRTFYTLFPIEDKRSKRVRILAELSAMGQNGLLSAHPDVVKLFEQWLKYPNVPYDDYLDALAIAMMGVNQLNLTGEGFESLLTDESIEHDDSWRACP